MLNMKEVADKLSEVKQELLAQAMEGKASPTILHMVQVAIDHLDTTYLWCGQVAGVQHMMAEETDKQAEAAVTSGTVKKLDFSGAGKTRGV